MKKMSFLVGFTLVFILNISSVLAEKSICNYQLMSNGAAGSLPIDKPFVIEYDIEQKKYDFGVETGKYNDNRGIVIGNYKYDGSATTSYEYSVFLNESESITELDNNSCLKLYYCFSSEYGGGQYTNGTKYVYIFYDELQKEQKTESTKKHKIESCYELSSNEVKEGTKREIYSCNTYSEYYSNIKDNLAIYNNTSNISSLNEAKNDINNLKKLCNTITQYSDYSSSCLKSCLNLQQDIKNLGMEKELDGYCGFSGKLIKWISNIIKWGKYLVPVIVMVLGILDFIKAIAADKEDEMKKAQGRFVKRLIAAALIFIVPFIIEFILNKLGFDAFGCGIIDL